MVRHIKNIVTVTWVICIAFSLNFVHATQPEWYISHILERCALYRQGMDEQKKPRILIIGSGRGELRLGDELRAKEYDRYAYGKRKDDYFLVDWSDTLMPDYICDAKNQEDMDILGPGMWDKCFLEFLPHRVNMDGALKNAFRLVKPGGKVYMNAEDFFHKIHDASDDLFPLRFRRFKNYLADSIVMDGLRGRPNFYKELDARCFGEKIDFFRYVYGLGKNIGDVKLVSQSPETWLAENHGVPDLHIWVITKAKPRNMAFSYL